MLKSSIKLLEIKIHFKKNGQSENRKARLHKIELKKKYVKKQNKVTKMLNFCIKKGLKGLIKENLYKFSRCCSTKKEVRVRFAPSPTGQ